MSDFSSWWEGLSISLKIYWGLAIPFTLFFLLQLILSFFGGGDVPDDSPDVDAEIDGDAGIPFQFLTLKNLVAFFFVDWNSMPGFGIVGNNIIDHCGFSGIGYDADHGFTLLFLRQGEA